MEERGEGQVEERFQFVKMNLATSQQNESLKKNVPVMVWIFLTLRMFPVPSSVLTHMTSLSPGDPFIL